MFVSLILGASRGGNGSGRLHQFLIENFITEFHAFITDVDSRTCNEFSYLFLGFSAKGAFEVGVILGHGEFLFE
jgi:hypothetical protein